MCRSGIVRGRKAVVVVLFKAIREARGSGYFLCKTVVTG